MLQSLNVKKLPNLILTHFKDLSNISVVIHSTKGLQKFTVLITSPNGRHYWA